MFVRSPCRGEVHCIYIQSRLVRLLKIPKMPSKKTRLRPFPGLEFAKSNDIKTLGIAIPYFLHFCRFFRPVQRRLARQHYNPITAKARRAIAAVSWQQVKCAVCSAGVQIVEFARYRNMDKPSPQKDTQPGDMKPGWVFWLWHFFERT